VISHDRYFLDRTTDRIIEIENGRAVSYKGNYSKFTVERELRREQQQREYENQRAMIAKTQEFIRRNLEGQKTKQAKSRRNMLERLERVDAVSSEKHGGNFGLKKVERTGNNVLTVEDLSVGYGETRLASELNFSLMRGEVLGIIGGNGTGKTTLLKTVLGELRQIAGSIHWGTKTNIGYYTQNLDDLEYRNEVVQELRRVSPLADNGELRSFLSRFLFFGDDVFKRVGDLSGGEKGRLALAKLIYSRKNVLILDEPTNHLDIPSREALEAALDEFDGTIIAVSHDRFFLDKIATQILAFEGDEVDVFNGNYTEYHDWREKKISDISATGKTVDGPVTAANVLQTPGAPPASMSKNERERMMKRVAAIEAEIPVLEEELAALTEELGLAEVVADYARLRDATKRFEAKEKQIRGLYEEWELYVEHQPSSG
jgi:ATP-binding cassette subfamily F protein 3